MEVNNIIAAASVADTVQSNVTPQSANSPKESERVSDSQDSEKASKLSKEEAEKEAKDLEQLLNKPAETEIKFNVSLVGTGEKSSVTDFKFQVVDKETGKIIRQFPPEDINGVKARAKAIPTIPGIFIHSVA